MRHHHLGLALTIAGAALFGTLGIFGKVAPAADLSTATLLGARFAAATVVFWLLLAASAHGRIRSRRLFVAEFGLGVVYGVMSVAYFEGLAWLSAGVAALLLFTYPVQVTLVSALALDEPVTIPKALALCAALGGVALVVDALVIRYVYDLDRRLTAGVTLIHAVVSVILGVIVFGLWTLVRSAPA